MKRQNTENLIQEIKEKGYITEQEINLLKRRINNGQSIDLSEINNNEITLTQEQTEKGYKFLLDKWQTEKGKERKNNPFGYREQNALDTFEYFRFDGFYDISNAFTPSSFVPLYTVIGKFGSFQYYYNGEVNIIN